MANDDQTAAKEVFSELSESFSVMMGAKLGKLDVPHTFETSSTGTRAETEGSIRHICDFLQESGYATSYDHLGQADPVIDSADKRHRYEITVTEQA